MKSLLSKTRLRALVLLGFAAFGFGATASYAQVANPAVVSANVNWVSVGDAMTRLDQQIGALQVQVQANGNNDHLVYKLKYYSTVHISIGEGMLVPTAVDANYGRFVPGIVDATGVEFPNAIQVPIWQQYRQELIQLLQN